MSSFESIDEDEFKLMDRINCTVQKVRRATGQSELDGVVAVDVLGGAGAVSVEGAARGQPNQTCHNQGYLEHFSLMQKNSRNAENMILRQDKRD